VKFYPYLHKFKNFALLFAYSKNLLYICSRKDWSAYYTYTIMNTFLRFLGIILVLLGVCCLVVYRFALPSNALLVTSLVLEVVGILCHIILNRKLD